jgi:hypothetical protein
MKPTISYCFRAKALPVTPRVENSLNFRPEFNPNLVFEFRSCWISYMLFRAEIQGIFNPRSDGWKIRKRKFRCLEYTKIYQNSIESLALIIIVWTHYSLTPLVYKFWRKTPTVSNPSFFKLLEFTKNCYYLQFLVMGENIKNGRRYLNF